MSEKPEEQQRQQAGATRYIGLGSQLMALIGVGVFGGYKLDEKLGFKALFIIIFPLIGLCYSLWQLIKTFSKK